MPDLSQSRAEDIPGSPIAGRDDLPADVGATELRRARAVVEVYYRAEPGEMVDIQARIEDAMHEVGRYGLDYRRGGSSDRDRDLGNVLATADLTEHVRLVTPSPANPSTAPTSSAVEQDPSAR